MGERKFRIFKVPDKELSDSLKNIAVECNASENVKLSYYLGQKGPQFQTDFTKIEQPLQDILSSESTIFCKISATFSNLNNSSVTIEREDGSDQATINFNDQITPTQSASLVAAAQKHLRTYERTESLDKLLGDELAEFYRRREQGLLRLEELADKLILRNEEYRKQVDVETSELRKQQQASVDAEKERLHQDYEEKEKHLKDREAKLEARTLDLDDRDSRHARRQIRQDLKKALADRSKEFILTKKTSRKRIPIHILFVLLIIAAGLLFGKSLIDQIYPPANFDILYIIIRLTTSTAALAAAMIFYIRWNDHWFSQHADEEFRLKRLELDIDRASWVAEMVFEWQVEKGTIPDELIHRLTRNLFSTEPDRETVKHPSEDLASALLSASSGLTVKIPGIGEVSLNRRGIKDFKKSAAKHSE